MSDLDIHLDNLDGQLQSYPAVQRWLLYILSAAGIVFMGWMFYLSDAVDELESLKEKNETLMRQIAENSPEAYQKKIAETDQAIIREKNRTVSLENEKEALLLQMSASQGLVFDNRHYAKMLDLLLERSVRLGLTIELMESEDMNRPFFGKVTEFKKLTVTGTGNFPAIADFLSFIETQNTLVQIESVEIRSDETKPRFTAVISYMGVAL